MAAFVVEAQRLFLSTMCSLVDRAGAEVVGADTELDLDDLVTTRAEVLVVDLDDSDYDVVETVEVVREELPGIAVVVLTRDLEPERVTALRAAGARGVIGKRHLPDDVEGRIRRALSGERVVDVDEAPSANDERGFGGGRGDQQRGGEEQGA